MNRLIDVETALGILGSSRDTFVESRRDESMLQVVRNVIKSKTNALNEEVPYKREK